MSNRQRVSSRYKPFFIVVTLSFIAIAGLGTLRFNASRMEHRLRSMERSIERYTAEKAELRRTLSSLTSPIRIHSYSREQLGMVVARPEIVHVQSAAGVASTAPTETQRGWNMLAFFGFTVN